MIAEALDPESARLLADERREANWKRWGPYLAERQWATVREDYSPDGACWGYFPFEHAHQRAYRWGEDGLLGFTDRECRLCFGLALWNGNDPLLKERLFGLTGPEGNHGEDAKECYYYLDSTPTHSYARALYKYPQRAFPYQQLREENARRGREQRELELEETGIFDGDRYFDVFIAYAKASPDDLRIRVRIENRGPEAASLHVLPTLWFRNTWSWGCRHEGCWRKPVLLGQPDGSVLADHVSLGRFRWSAANASDGSAAELLFTENETNVEALFQAPNASPYVKDAFHRYVVHGEKGAVNPARRGTKAAFLYALRIPAGGHVTLELELASEDAARAARESTREVFLRREREAEEFYARRIPAHVEGEARAVARAAYAGLLWSKQFYHYAVQDWLEGDPDQPSPPRERHAGRNAEWKHLFNRDVISMPDKWEYPWYAAWDLAFHMLPMARVDPRFAKDQLLLFLREWYMHPNGQLPAYEFALGDVNPPVHAWAVWRVYKIAAKRGDRDRDFLERAFQKLLLNFTWWVNRKDAHGKNLFSGGFLGLDNIGVFDRSKPLPTGGHLEQADGTAWMAFYAATMLAMALELAEENPAYEDLASKFFEHFVAIADAMNHLGGAGLWDDADGFYYDQLHAEGRALPLRVRSMVGLIPLFAVEVLEDSRLAKLPGFQKRLQWFLEHRRDLKRSTALLEPNDDGHRLLAIPTRERLLRVLQYVLDEAEFLSPHGVRSLSRVHAEVPYLFWAGSEVFRVDYDPGESSTGLFGGNSNWRGPVWFPVNYLLIEALQRYHHFYGAELRVEFPRGSGQRLDLQQVARELARRMSALFLPDEQGKRPCHGGDPRYAGDPHWKELVLFHEHFHGDDGRGLGASHQTGWTALVVRCLEEAFAPDESPAIEEHEGVLAEGARS